MKIRPQNVYIFPTVVQREVCLNRFFFLLVVNVCINIFWLGRPIDLIFLLTHSPGLVECFRYPKHYHWITRKFSRALSISTFISKASFFTNFKPFRTPNYANVRIRIFKNQQFFTFATIESVLDVVGPWNFFLSKGMISDNHPRPLVVIGECAKIFSRTSKP